MAELKTAAIDRSRFYVNTRPRGVKQN
ncbi:hypothetical protein THICB2_30034 [Thiomonas sp. CB2]|nr:hypothetical protein THICB2_30034 [Thiomonas sp. CB2]VDY06486.1 protein of unknown function [Thiomonas sp. Bio17B3]VDY10218.1 protein of unknown function [Thiomonas sp. Sup16B3]VDY14759.1 conserved protein of unknown function [Thiomonas sp. OC7]